MHSFFFVPLIYFMHCFIILPICILFFRVKITQPNVRFYVPCKLCWVPLFLLYISIAMGIASLPMPWYQLWHRTARFCLQELVHRTREYYQENVSYWHESGVFSVCWAKTLGRAICFCSAEHEVCCSGDCLVLLWFFFSNSCFIFILSLTMWRLLTQMLLGVVIFHFLARCFVCVVGATVSNHDARYESLHSVQAGWNHEGLVFGGTVKK